MNKALVGIVFVVAAVLTGSMAHADEKAPEISDEIVKNIESRCSEIKTKLRSIEEDDVATRIIRGRVYQSDITEKLMVPLNRRVTDSRLDGSALVLVTANYDTAVRDFSASYRSYEDALAKTLRIDCKKNPRQFYDALALARKMRVVLSNSTVNLKELIDSYRSKVQEFTKLELEASDDRRTP